MFAPHYAAPMPRTLARATALRADRTPDSEVLAQLQPGDVFELLELAGANGWGVAPALGLVGYLDADSLADATQ